MLVGVAKTQILMASIKMCHYCPELNGSNDTNCCLGMSKVKQTVTLTVISCSCSGYRNDIFLFNN